MIYPKVEDLRNRKTKLKSELVRLSEKIKETEKRIVERGLETYIQKGAVKAPLKSELADLEKRHNFLQQVDKKLNEELVKAVRHTRFLNITRLEREIEREESERKKLYQKYVALLEKIEKLKEKERTVKERKTKLETELRNTRSQEKTATVTKRLNKLESFLAENLLLGDDLKIKVLEARKCNKKVLKQSRIGSSDIIYRNFQITFNRDTGQTVKLSLLEQNAEAVLRNVDKKNSLTRKELVEEVT